MTEIQTKTVTFASDYTTKGGRSYKAGSTHTINSPEARILISLGKARLADDTPTVDEPAADATATPAADSAGDGPTAATAKKGK